MAYVSLDSEQVKKAHKKHKYDKTQVVQPEFYYICVSYELF